MYESSDISRKIEDILIVVIGNNDGIALIVRPPFRANKSSCMFITINNIRWKCDGIPLTTSYFTKWTIIVSWSFKKTLQS